MVIAKLYPIELKGCDSSLETARKLAQFFLDYDNSYGKAFILSVCYKTDTGLKSSIIGQEKYYYNSQSCRYLSDCSLEIVSDFSLDFSRIAKEHHCVVEVVTLAADEEYREIWMFDGRKVLDEHTEIQYDTKNARTHAICITAYGVADYIKNETHYLNPSYKSKNIFDVIEAEYEQSCINYDLTAT